MIIHRADGRCVTDQPNIRTWHAFSAGSHYDPDNVSFGPVIGCDEHLVDAGAGFEWHAHRGVVIVSWVLAGTLRHEDDGGVALLVPAGEVLVQSTGDGIRHSETNGSGVEPLRFVQTTLLLDLERSVQCPDLPARIGDVVVDIVAAPAVIGPGYAVVGAGHIEVDGVRLQAGDSLRLERAVDVIGDGTTLVVRFES